MLISRLTTNFKKTEFWTNRRLQMGILATATVITAATKFFPTISDNVMMIVFGLIALGGPVTIMAIYDGILGENSSDDGDCDS